MHPVRILFFLIVILLLISSCRKEPDIFDQQAEITFSADTVLFDTVFTSIGSATLQFRVYNNSSRPVLLDRIALAGGSSSQFRFNIDGIPGPSVTGLKVPPKDSLFVFVEVTVDPLNSNSPLVVSDSILFEYNGKQADLDLVAWGQDVHYINGEIICSQTWTNDKPYLVYNSMLVDTLCVLTIMPGTRVHFHPGSRMFVKGTLKINGDKDNPVVLQGDRLEQYYRNIPSQWVGIWLMAGSKDNVIDHADIRNGILGIQVDSNVTAPPTLLLTNSRISNMSLAGMLAQGAKVEAGNTLFSNCGQYLAALTIGGDYAFTHCTFNNYWGESARNTPSVVLNNYYKDIHGNTQVRNLERAVFYNSIINGGLANEVGFDVNQAGDFNYNFDHCIIKMEESISPDQNWYNIAPGFKDSLNDPELAAGAFSIDRGDPALMGPYTSDMLGRPRGNAPDLGALEFSP